MLNYHAFSDSKNLIKSCHTVQVSLSGFRKISGPEMETHVENWNIEQDVVFHQDYFRPATKYLLFSDSIRKAMIEELAVLLTVGNKYKANVLGIVMHTDAICSLAQYNTLPPNLMNFTYTKLYDFYKTFKSKMYQVPLQTLKSVLVDINPSLAASREEFIQALERESLSLLERDLLIKIKQLGKPITGLIFLENTTRNIKKASLSGKLKNIKDIAAESEVFGFCLDTEHAFASGQSIDKHLYTADLVHVNAIPDEVTFGSGLDRHSKTTIFECSIHPAEYYLKLISHLNKFKTPYIREVKPPAMQRELQQLKDFHNKD